MLCDPRAEIESWSELLSVAILFPRSFSLYGERVGSLSFAAMTQTFPKMYWVSFKATVRRIYSSPAANGALLVSQVLDDTALSQLWQSELEEMRQRVFTDESLTLKTKLSQALPDMDFGYLTQQQGMFSYTGLSAENRSIC